MKKAYVELTGRRYPVFVASGLAGLAAIIKKNYTSKIGVITTNKIAGLHLNDLKHELSKTNINFEPLFIPDGEKYKTLSTVGGLLSKLLSLKFDRKSALIAFGGGVVGDICGFTASTYMRGLKFFQLPTTLLAQVDASIGGKTAVNLPAAKNAVGTFYQPECVWSNISFLRTLPEKERLNGMAEVIKYGVIMDSKFFDYLEKNTLQLAGREFMEHIVYKSAKCKAEVVSKDEKETEGLREILNFGHTFGHLLESYYGYERISHGEAVSIGMVLAAKLAERIGIFKETKRLINILQKYKLPTTPPKPIIGTAWHSILFGDKKFIGGASRFILPERIGRVKIVKGIDISLIKSIISGK